MKQMMKKKNKLILKFTKDFLFKSSEKLSLNNKHLKSYK